MAAAEAARAIVPEAPEGYAVTLPDNLVKYTGAADDPVMKALRDHAVEQKWPQGKFDDTVGLIKVFADKGVLLPLFDPAAEAAKLGDKAPARRAEVETFAKALKERGEINDEEFGEIAALAATASGVTLFEKMRKWMVPGVGAGPIPPGQSDQSQDSPEMAAAKEMRLDPKYNSDSRFKRAADAAWVAAFKAGQKT